MGATLVLVRDAGGGAAGPAKRSDALGEGQLGSSIFRAIAEIAPDEGSPTQLYGEQAARVAVRLKALNDFHRALAGAISLEALLELLLDQLFAALHPEEGVILLRQPGGTLRTAASRRLPGASGELLVSQRLTAEVVDKGTAALVTDVALDERFASSQSIVATGIRSILAAPFTDIEGCVGMVAIYSRTSVRRFGEEDLELLVSLASAAALRIRNVELAEEAAARRVQDRELALAHDIQMAMLPRAIPERREIELAASLIPARAVGGDLYDFLLVDDALWFIVADAAGKGVSAALFMAVTRTLFRAIAHGGATVSSALERMNAEPRVTTSGSSSSPRSSAGSSSAQACSPSAMPAIRCRCGQQLTTAPAQWRPWRREWRSALSRTRSCGNPRDESRAATCCCCSPTASPKLSAAGASCSRTPGCSANSRNAPARQHPPSSKRSSRPSTRSPRAPRRKMT
jgi:hypothetical protein